MKHIPKFPKFLTKLCNLEKYDIMSLAKCALQNFWIIYVSSVDWYTYYIKEKFGLAKKIQNSLKFPFWNLYW